MGLFILIAMIGVPIAEIAVFIEVGEKIGLVATLVIVVATAIMGTALLRQQGFSVLARAQNSLSQNRFPMNELFDGLCLLFAGALLLTPGFVTDTIGFLLFVPPFRTLIGSWVSKAMLARGHIHMEQTVYPGSQHGEKYGTVIDGEFSDITNDGHKNTKTTGQGRKLPSN
jgi:UPF0716 protein FxsA